MDYEEQYREALDRAKRLYEKGTITESIGYIFPELKESEDEKFRNNCIHFLELQKSHHASTIEIDKCINWLETLNENRFVYVVTRCEEHSDYVEAVFLNKEKAEAYCEQFNKNEECYRRHITKAKID